MKDPPTWADTAAIAENNPPDTDTSTKENDKNPQKNENYKNTKKNNPTTTAAAATSPTTASTTAKATLTFGEDLAEAIKAAHCRMEETLTRGSELSKADQALLDLLDYTMGYVESILPEKWPSMLNRLEGASTKFILKSTAALGTDKFTGNHTNLQLAGDEITDIAEAEEQIEKHLKVDLVSMMQQQLNSEMEDKKKKAIFKAYIYASERDLFRTRFLANEELRVVYDTTIQKFRELFPSFTVRKVVEQVIGYFPTFNDGANNMKVFGTTYDNVGLFKLKHPAEKWNVKKCIKMFFNDDKSDYSDELLRLAYLPATDYNIEFTILDSEVHNAKRGTRKAYSSRKSTHSYFLIGYNGKSVPKQTRYFLDNHRLTLCSTTKFCTACRTIGHTRWSCVNSSSCLKCGDPSHSTGHHNAWYDRQETDNQDNNDGYTTVGKKRKRKRKSKSNTTSTATANTATATTATATKATATTSTATQATTQADTTKAVTTQATTQADTQPSAIQATTQADTQADTPPSAIQANTQADATEAVTTQADTQSTVQTLDKNNTQKISKVAPSQDVEQLDEINTPSWLASQAMLPIPEAPSQEVELNEGPDKLLFDENEYIETHDYFEPSDFYNSGDDDDYMDEDSEEENSEEEDSEDDDEMSIDAVSENEIDDLQKENENDQY